MFPCAACQQTSERSYEKLISIRSTKKTFFVIGERVTAFLHEHDQQRRTIPHGVLDEVVLRGDLPGASEVREARDSGWISS